MWRYRVLPSIEVGGEVTVPGDKSISHRALMLGGIASGVTRVSGFLAGADCLSTLSALESMGVRIDRPADTDVVIHGVGGDGLSQPSAPLDMGNAGTAMRLFMGLLASQRFDSTLIGDSSLMRRPMERAAKPLRKMGAIIRTHDGKPPVEIRGQQALHGIDFTMPVASAQVKSAVLLAALRAHGVTRVVEPAPTRDHTERMLGGFGVKVDRAGPEARIVGGQSLTATNVDVPGDISSAAFFLVAGALAAKRGLLLRNVGVNPTRTGIVDILKLMGADIRVQPRASAPEPTADIEVRASRLRGIVVPRELVPLAIDELPVFFIAAAAAQGESMLRGAEELRVKESDRLAAMSAGFTTTGVEHELYADGMRIVGGGPLRGGVIDSHGDHRIAMSFAVASLLAKEPLEILDVANVATSFPGFDRLATSAGLALESLGQAAA